MAVSPSGTSRTDTDVSAMRVSRDGRRPRTETRGLRLWCRERSLVSDNDTKDLGSSSRVTVCVSVEGLGWGEEGPLVPRRRKEEVGVIVAVLSIGAS